MTQRIGRLRHNKSLELIAGRLSGSRGWSVSNWGVAIPTGWQLNSMLCGFMIYGSMYGMYMWELVQKRRRNCV